MPNISAGGAAAGGPTPLVVSPRGMLAPAALAFSRWRERAFWALLQGPAIPHAYMPPASRNLKRSGLRPCQSSRDHPQRDRLGRARLIAERSAGDRRCGPDKILRAHQINLSGRREFACRKARARRRHEQGGGPFALRSRGDAEHFR